MNTLSWFLYAAGVAEGFGTFLGVVAVIASVAIGICLAAGASMKSGCYRHEDPDWVLANNLQIRAAKFVIIPVLFGLISCLVPSKDTMYAIAASEMGEKAMQTPAFNKATAALNHWLDKQIADKSESTEKKEESK